jgi:hypothetical protein
VTPLAVVVLLAAALVAVAAPTVVALAVAVAMAWTPPAGAPPVRRWVFVYLGVVLAMVGAAAVVQLVALLVGVL